MKKWIICVIVFIVLLIVGYGVYVFVFIIDDIDECNQYPFNNPPYVRCSYKNFNGKTHYCRKEINCCEYCNCERYVVTCVDKIYKILYK